ATQVQLRSTLYTAHMNLAQRAWEAGGAEQVRDLLEKYRPKPGETDLRGFEWGYFYRLSHAELFALRHTATVFKVAYSSDGKRLAGSSYDYGSREGTVKVWDVQTGQEHGTFPLKGASYGAVFSPDGKLVASEGDNSTVKVWDTQSAQELRTLKVAGG